ncbi:MlaD family protein [Albimonas sp. CAU 1670]|uniref:MCE family protein n=1 Tax=Albimonas sp. CAU 1670 TaxID=3032599 RepID=UPI0023D9B9A2|nr:MlaD family protein [Albimonas sp. CAU 1670]MDF2231857.1 MlaD family protein [Albimonas sp. CAU 1670]
METRANYVLIGAFALAGLIGALGFLLWLAKVQVDRSYAYYDILFESVSGLNEAGDVRFNGLPVGQVVSLGLDQDDPSKVRVVVEIDATTPIKTDTEATLEMAGVTGVSYVSLSGGTAEAPLLRNQPGRPTIQSKPSAFQSLFDGAPALLNQAIDLLEDVKGFVNDENQQAVRDILANVSDASSKLNSTLSSVDTLSADVGSAAQKLTDFTDRLEALADTADETLRTATEAIDKSKATIDAATTTIDTAGEAFASADLLMKDRIPGLLTQGETTLKAAEDAVRGLQDQVGRTIETADALMQTRVPEAVDRVSEAALALQTTTTALGGRAAETLDRFAEAGAEAALRLREAEETLANLKTTMANADRLMASLEDTSNTVNALAQGDGAAMVAEARTALASADTLMKEQLGPLAETARQTTINLDQRIAVIAEDAEKLIETTQSRLDSTQEVMAKASVAIDQATATMASIQQTSDGIDQLARGDGAALVAEARLAATDARAAIETINGIIQSDVPAVVAEVRAAATTANQAIQRVANDFSGAAGKLDPLVLQAEQALATASATFANANATLGSITSAMGKADTALTSAQATFDSVNGLVEGDIADTIADVRVAVGTLEDTVAKMSSDFEAITGDVKGAAGSANQLMGSLNSTLSRNQYQVDDFLRTGLPQIVRFVEEGRRLISNLERISNRVERDPARFILGTQSSEISR